MAQKCAKSNGFVPYEFCDIFNYEIISAFREMSLRAILTRATICAYIINVNILL